MTQLTLESARARGVLLISNLFAAGAVYGGMCKAVAAQLGAQGWRVSTTSTVNNRLLRPADMLYTIWRARDAYAVAQIDVFSGSAFQWAETSAALLKRLHKPYVLVLRGGNLAAYAQTRRERVQYLLRDAAAVVTPSHMLHQALRDLRPDLAVLPNALDLTPYAWRERTQPAPRIAWLRAIHSMYAPQIAVEAVGLLSADLPDLQLDLIGPVKENGALEQVQAAITRWKLADRVRVVGAIPKADVPATLAGYDVFLNTTTIESFGMSVLEAAAGGMCIVTTTAGELPYIWTHEHDALLVPPNDAQATADAIRRLLTDPALAARLSINARQTAERYTWTSVLPQWESLLARVQSAAR